MKSIAIDLGASKLRVALVNKRGIIEKKEEIKTPKKELLKEVDLLVRKMREEGVEGIGVSSMGFLDQKGVIHNPANLPYKKIPLKGFLQKNFSLPIEIKNDGLAGAWGEKVYGEGKKYKNLIYLTFSSGIGGGIIENNRPLFGKNNNAGEVGHLTVDSKYNLPCKCQKGKGHWESYCSGNNIPSFFKEWLKFHKKESDLKTTKEILQEKETISKFIKELTEINMRGISDLSACFDPEIIFFGGPVFLENKEAMFSPLKKQEFINDPKLKISSLKENAPLLGASAFILHPF